MLAVIAREIATLVSMLIFAACLLFWAAYLEGIIHCMFC